MRKLINLIGNLGVIKALRGIGSLSKTRYSYEQLNLDGSLRKVRWWNKATAFGAVFLPDSEWIHGSRQVRRATLRTICFGEVSKKWDIPRRNRRLIARKQAVRKYQLAMADLTHDDYGFRAQAASAGA